MANVGGVPDCIYSALEGPARQSRLLMLHAGLPTEIIKCSLLRWPIDEPSRPYIALSYVWGSDGPANTILVNGIQVQIRSNLFAALNAIRTHFRDDLVWVDALCINQNNIDERQRQVAQMGAIFQRATHVLAWLGQSSDGSDDVMKTIENEDAWPQSPSDTGHSDRPLRKFWERPYWTRVWIIQELSLAKKIIFQCGTCTASEHRMFRWMTLTTEHMRVSARLSEGVRDSPFWKFKQCLNLINIHKGVRFSNVLKILLDAADLEATILSDKLFGLLQLFPLPLRNNFEPNYQVPYSDLSCQLVEALLRHQNKNIGGLDMLCYFKPLYLSQADCWTGVPSWAVDLRQTWKYFGYVRDSLHAKPCDAKVHGSTLVASGFSISNVNNVVGPLESRASVLSYNLTTSGRLLPLEAAFRSVLPLGLRSLRILSPTATDEFHRQSLSRLLSSSDDFCSLWSDMVRLERTCSAEAEPSGLQVSDALRILEDRGPRLELAFPRLPGRCFFTTSIGLVGLGPSNMTPGDVLCVLAGCQMPLVLRRTFSHGADEPFYRLLGPACTNFETSDFGNLGKSREVFNIR